MSDEQPMLDTGPRLRVRNCPYALFAGVLNYETCRLQNEESKYGPKQSKQIGRTAVRVKQVLHPVGGQAVFSGKEPLYLFRWLRKFVPT